MGIEKIGGNPSVVGSSPPFPNISSQKILLGKKIQDTSSIAAVAVSSVRSNLSNNLRHKEVIAMAWEHERLQEHPSKNIDVVIERFIIYLIKSGEDHGPLIRDLHEARSKLPI